MLKAEGEVEILNSSYFSHASDNFLISILF